MSLSLPSCPFCSAPVEEEPQCECSRCQAGACSACCCFWPEVERMVNEWFPRSAYCSCGDRLEGDYTRCRECQDAEMWEELCAE
jgi:hypothetical protein